jgi:uncharacterized protein (DUF1501 family)
MTASMPANHDLVVIQLSGGNDYLNTTIPYSNPRYYDCRPTLGLHPDRILPVSFNNRDRPELRGPSVLPFDERIGLHGALAPFKGLYDEGKLAVLLGIGYPNHNRSHFRSMDIWHTGVPETYSNVGWLGKTASLIDPERRNPVLVANLGRSAPLALAHPGVLAASLDSLATYNIFPDELRDVVAHARLCGIARRIYDAADEGSRARHARAIGQHALKGIDLLRSAAASPASVVDYPPFNALADHLRTIARIKSAGLGTRIFYANHGGYDTHNDQLTTQQRLFEQLGGAVAAFLKDLESRGLADDTTILIFSEFGRRIVENGGGTDHGGAGVAFLIGNHVKGGLYGEYPSLRPEDQVDGDVRPTLDFREAYAAILEQFIGVDPRDVFGRAVQPLSLRKVA